MYVLLWNWSYDFLGSVIEAFIIWSLERDSSCLLLELYLDINPSILSKDFEVGTRDQWLYCDVWMNVILWWVLEFKSLWRLSIDNVLFHLTCIYVKAFMFWSFNQKLFIVKVDIKMIVWKTVYWKWLWFNFHEFVSRFWKDAWTFIFFFKKKGVWSLLS